KEKFPGLSEEAVERNVKRYHILQETSKKAYVKKGSIQNLDEVFESGGTNYYPVKDTLEDLVNDLFEESSEEFRDEEVSKLIRILQSSKKENWMMRQVGSQSKSLGRGTWRLWMLDIMEGNSDEAVRFSRLAAGQTIGSKLKGPGKYGLLNAGSHISSEIDSAINSYYTCDENELCLIAGRKTYSALIDPDCEVRLDRNVPITSGLDDPRFYLVSPCYAELEVKKGTYQNKESIVKYTGDDLGKGLDKFKDSNNEITSREVLSRNIDFNTEIIEHPKTDLTDKEKKELRNNDNFVGETRGYILYNEGDREIKKFKDQISEEELEKIRENKDIVEETVGVIKLEMDGDDLSLKEDKKEGKYVSEILELKNNKKFKRDIFAGEVRTNLEKNCIDVDILDKEGKELISYGDCDSDNRGLCNGTFHFDMKSEENRLPDKFRIRFNFHKESPGVESPRLLRYTVSRVEDKGDSVMITPKLCSNSEEYKKNIVFKSNFEGKEENGKIEEFWEERNFPNYCYASSTMISKYSAKEWAGAAISMMTFIPGVNVFGAVAGGLIANAYGESFINWPYPYMDNGRVQGIPVREDEKCPAHLSG
ncbi:MAG: hypothetical protein ABEK36_01110, partial [Candidatus Aenigmatarchaeota archaeon]